MMPSIQKSQSGNKDIDSSKLDTKQDLAKNSQNITKREQLEKLMAKEADPTAIPEIEKGNDSVNNTKSPEANKNFFTKSIEIVFNTLDKRLLKPIIKLAQHITGFKTSNKGASSENVEDPEQAKLIQEIANKKLDLSKVKDPKERKRIEILQKRLGDEGLKLNTETKGALVEIIRGAEKTGRIDEKGLPDCCRIQVDAVTEKRTKQLTEELIGTNKPDNSSNQLPTQSQQSPKALSSPSSSGQTKLNIPFLSFIQRVVSEVRKNLSNGSLSEEQKTLFSELMLKSETRQNLRKSFRKSAPKTAGIMAQLINQELSLYKKNNPAGPKFKNYQKFMHDTCIGGVEAKNTDVNQKDDDMYQKIAVSYGEAAAKKQIEEDDASEKLRKLYNENPDLQKEINQRAKERKETDPKFKDRLRDDRETVLLEIALEIAAGEKDSESNSAKTTPQKTQINDSPASSNQQTTVEAVTISTETITHHTETAADRSNPQTVIKESSSPTITETHEEKQAINQGINNHEA